MCRVQKHDQMYENYTHTECNIQSRFSKTPKDQLFIYLLFYWRLIYLFIVADEWWWVSPIKLVLVTREQCSTVVTVTIIVLHTHDTAADHLPQLPPTSPETDEGVTSKYRDTHYTLLLCNNIIKRLYYYIIALFTQWRFYCLGLSVSWPNHLSFFLGLFIHHMVHKML